MRGGHWQTKDDDALAVRAVNSVWLYLQNQLTSHGLSILGSVAPSIILYGTKPPTHYLTVSAPYVSTVTPDNGFCMVVHNCRSDILLAQTTHREPDSHYGLLTYQSGHKVRYHTTTAQDKLTYNASNRLTAQPCVELFHISCLVWHLMSMSIKLLF